jgi:branched-chain amino acid transport system permease protein
MMKLLGSFNLRDKGAAIWAGWNRITRTIFVIAMIVVAGLLPFAAAWGPTSFLDTPIASYQNVLVFPIGMFILMALGLNIVVGKSGLLDRRCSAGTLGRSCPSVLHLRCFQG